MPNEGSRILAGLDRLSGSINQWAEYSLFGMGFAMSAIVGLQVFFRYVLNHSLFWSEELARYLLVWLTFLGASVAYRRKMHPGVDLFYARMPLALQRLAGILVYAASIGFFWVLIIWGAKFAYFVRFQITPALSLPKWTVFSIIPISGAILMVHGVLFLLREILGQDRS